MPLVTSSVRRSALRRAGALSLCLLVASACADDRLSPESETPGTASPAGGTALYTGATAPGIAFASFGIDVSLLGTVHTGSIKQPDTSNILSLLSGARSKGARIVVKLSGNDKYYKNADGTFNLTKWKTMVDRFKTVSIGGYITDGTLLGHLLIDEPYLAARWGGHVIPHTTLEAMAKYSKQIWPGMTTIVQATPRWLATSTTTYVYLDAGWAQYVWSMGDAATWIGKESAAAKTKGLGLIVGLNVLDGGNGSSGIAGTRTNRWAMSGTELKSYGGALLAQSRACAFAMWQYNSTYYSRSGISSAMTTLADKARTHVKTSCRL
jgi:hypothetical protein